MLHTGVVSAVQFDINYLPARLRAGLFQSGLQPNRMVLRSRQIAPDSIACWSTARTFCLGNELYLGGLPFAVPVGTCRVGGRSYFRCLASTDQSSLVAPVRLVHGAVLVGPVFRGLDGVVDLFLTVQANRTYVIQATTNFKEWVNLSTNVASLDYIVYRDLAGRGHRRHGFYRAYRSEPMWGRDEIPGADGSAASFSFVYPAIPGQLMSRSPAPT